MTGPASGRSLFREIETWLLILLVVGIYFSRLTTLTIRGEESRWARVAQEMAASGDWIVPRQQGEPFPDRPPLNSWAMILAARLVGGFSLVAVRLPSVLATLLTTLAIYAYSRQYLSRVGALAAGAAFATMGQVLQLGRLAESDALLTLFVTCGLFAWHAGYAVRHDARSAWLWGYFAAALAGLTKGPQGPIYFVAITCLFLAARRDWRFLLSRWHFVGIAMFVVILGIWQLPFLQSLDWKHARAVWSEGGEVGTRFQYASLGKALGHWLGYPFEVFACMLPWSFLLPVLATRWLRENLREARPMVLFLLTACAVAFPSCWLPAHSRARYFMSLYPCIAPLMGLVVERSWQATSDGWWQRSWDRYLRGGIALITMAGLGLVLAKPLGRIDELEMLDALSWQFILCYAVAAIAAIAICVWSRRRQEVLRVRMAILTLAGFWGLTYTGAVMNLQSFTANNPAHDIRAVHDLIPADEHLVSLGPVHHLFAYYYQDPIELKKLSRRREVPPVDATYFCFSIDPSVPAVEISFPWQRIAEISCERARSSQPKVKVIVGKRITSLAQEDFTPDEQGFASHVLDIPNSPSSSAMD